MSDYAAKLIEIAESQYGDPAAGDRLLHANWIRGAAEHIKATESRLDSALSEAARADAQRQGLIDALAAANREVERGNRMLSEERSRLDQIRSLMLDGKAEDVYDLLVKGTPELDEFAKRLGDTVQTEDGPMRIEIVAVEGQGARAIDSAVEIHAHFDSYRCGHKYDNAGPVDRSFEVSCPKCYKPSPE